MENRRVVSIRNWEITSAIPFIICFPYPDYQISQSFITLLILCTIFMYAPYIMMIVNYLIIDCVFFGASITFDNYDINIFMIITEYSEYNEEHSVASNTLTYKEQENEITSIIHQVQLG